MPEESDRLLSHPSLLCYSFSDPPKSGSFEPQRPSDYERATNLFTTRPLPRQARGGSRAPEQRRPRADSRVSSHGRY